MQLISTDLSITSNITQILILKRELRNYIKLASYIHNYVFGHTWLVSFRLRFLGTFFSLEGDNKVNLLLQLFSSKI